MAGGKDLVKLQSSQGEIFEVMPDVACMSQLVKDIRNAGAADEKILLSNVTTATLKDVVNYCNYRKDKPSAKIEFKGTKESLFELVRAANYLDISGLLEWTCAKVASMAYDSALHNRDDDYNVLDDGYTDLNIISNIMERFENMVNERLQERKEIEFARVCEQDLGSEEWSKLSPETKLRRISEVRKRAPKYFYDIHDPATPPRKKLRRVVTAVTPEHGRLYVPQGVISNLLK